MRPEAALAGTPPLWGARGFGLSWADGRELPGTCELRSEAKQKVLSRSLPEVRAANWHLLAGRQAGLAGLTQDLKMEFVAKCISMDLRPVAEPNTQHHRGLHDTGAWIFSLA